MNQRLQLWGEVEFGHHPAPVTVISDSSFLYPSLSIRNRKSSLFNACALYEIKHSSQYVREQGKQLIDKKSYLWTDPDMEILQVGMFCILVKIWIVRMELHIVMYLNYCKSFQKQHLKVDLKKISDVRKLYSECYQKIHPIRMDLYPCKPRLLRRPRCPVLGYN